MTGMFFKLLKLMHAKSVSSFFFTVKLMARHEAEDVISS